MANSSGIARNMMLPKQPENEARRATDAQQPAGTADAQPADRRSDDGAVKVGSQDGCAKNAPVAAATSRPWFWGRSFFGRDAFTNSAADRKETP
jgi:hypothetical protein